MSGADPIAIKGFDHVGIVVADLGPVRTFFGPLVGAEIDEPVRDTAIGHEILWVHIGGVALEFLRPLDPAGIGARLLAEGRAGVHHIAFEVEDIDETLRRARRDGIALRDQVARPGAAGSRIAFLADAAVGGTVIELVDHTTPPE